MLTALIVIGCLSFGACVGAVAMAVAVMASQPDDGDADTFTNGF